MITVPEAMLSSERQRIVDLATAAQMPGIYPDRLFAEWPAVTFFPSTAPMSSTLPSSVRRYVDRILKGAKPADLPVCNRPSSTW